MAVDQTGRMAHERMDKWMWILIFGGLIAFGVGLSVARSDTSIGWAFCAAGALGVVVGVGMLWSRSRSRARTRALTRAHRLPPARTHSNTKASP